MQACACGALWVPVRVCAAAVPPPTPTAAAGEVLRGGGRYLPVADARCKPFLGRGRRAQSETAYFLCAAPIPRPIQLEPNTLRPRRFVWIPREWSPRIEPQLQAESQRDQRGAHWAPLLGTPENRALDIKIRATPRPETGPGVVGRSGRPMFIGPEQKSHVQSVFGSVCMAKTLFFSGSGPCGAAEGTA